MPNDKLLSYYSNVPMQSIAQLFAALNFCLHVGEPGNKAIIATGIANGMVRLEV